jgi:hypothetical protein
LVVAVTSLTARHIEVTFKLGTGSFGADGSDTVSLTGLRCSANIVKTSGGSMSQLDLRVWGAPLNVMNKLTVLNMLAQFQARQNTVTVAADGAVCFTGIISEAWTSASSQPDVEFVVSAHTGLVEALRPVPPVSYSGSVDVATMLAGICAQALPPLTLQNSGVTGRLTDQYLPGTTLEQIRKVARAANINAVIDDNHVLAVWPAGGARNGSAVLLSPSTGLVGYPAFTQRGIQVTTLYNPSLTFGATVEVQSQLTPANGFWTVASVSHNLDAEMPGGQWFTRIECSLLGQTVAIAG